MVTLIVVKRIGAMLLLGVISFLLIAPVAIAQDPESQLPACCRTHGKHHCMMSTADASAASAGVSLRATHARCPLFPRAGVLGCYHGTVTLTASQQFFAGIVSYPAAPAQTEALYRISYNRSCQKRGPPSLS
jgi:hypothetical protein